MTNKENELLKRLQAMFRIEAEDRLKVLSSGFLELEKVTEPTKQTEIIESRFSRSS